MVDCILLALALFVLFEVIDPGKPDVRPRSLTVYHVAVHAACQPKKVRSRCPNGQGIDGNSTITSAFGHSPHPGTEIHVK
jgi:hypothetical protein